MIFTVRANGKSRRYMISIDAKQVTILFLCQINDKLTHFIAKYLIKYSLSIIYFCKMCIF